MRLLKCSSFSEESSQVLITLPLGVTTRLKVFRRYRGSADRIIQMTPQSWLLGPDFETEREKRLVDS